MDSEVGGDNLYRCIAVLYYCTLANLGLIYQLSKEKN